MNKLPGPTKIDIRADRTKKQKAPPVDIAQLRIPSSLPLTTDDPNFDPGWDWTLDEPQDLFALTQSGIQMFENVRLPYYADNGPAANDFNSDAPGVRDILPQDGWVLLFRDFGTPQRGTAFPRFMLYNRFRGLLRLFYFNPHFPEVFTYGVVTLQKQNASDGFALFTFTDEKKATISDFDPGRKEVFIGNLEPVTWNYADFLVLGFDPDLPDDARFQFEITGVRESDITLEGNLTLNQVLKKKNLAASRSGALEEILAIGEGTASVFKNLGSIKEALGKIAENVVSLAQMSGLISGGIAIFKLFLSGSKPQQPQVLLNFKGEIKLSGTIRLQGAVGSFLLRVPGARHLGNTDLPFYDKPLGIYNLHSKPVIDLKIVQESTKCLNTDDFGPKTIPVLLHKRHEHKLRRPQVIFNPEAGITGFVETALVRPDGKLDFAQPGGSDGYFALGKIPTAVDLIKRDCEIPEPFVQTRRVAIRLTIRPEETIPDFTPVSIVKLYPVEYAISEVVL